MATRASSRYWLNLDVTITDTRLGWLQRQFFLSGDNVRALVLKEPRIIAFGVGPLTVGVQIFLRLQTYIRFSACLFSSIAS